MNLYLDGLSALEREKLSAQLAVSLGSLNASHGPLERIRIGGQVADLLLKLGDSDDGPSGITETPEFKNWFGKSQVVGNDGNPLVAYHGTGSDFTTFRPSERGNLGAGYYVTLSSEAAEEFAKRATFKKGGEGASVMPLFVKAESILDLDDLTKEDTARLAGAIPREAEGLIPFGYPSAMVQEAGKYINEDLEKLHNSLNRGYFHSARLSEILGQIDNATDVLGRIYAKAGYDGVARTGDALKNGVIYREIVVFRPEQIKSALGNSGGFNPDSAGILDSISPLERIKLSALLPVEIEALTGSSPMQRVQIAGRIAAILEQLGQDSPAAIPPIELSGNEFGEFPDTPEGAAQRREAALDHYMQQLVPSNGVFCQALNVKVQFNRTGAQKAISFGGDPRKVKLIAALPEIIATGRKTSEEAPKEKAAKSGVVKVFVLKADVNLEGQMIRARVLVRQMADGTYGYDHSVDRSEAAQVTGGIRGALDSVVSTENGRSVLLSDEASPGRDLRNLNQMIGEEGEACNVLDSVGGEVLNLFLDDEVVAEEPVRLKNFGWDRVKLAAHSFEQLEQLRHQVEAEHANPRDENGRYLESGQPSLYLYDKKGRWKLDQLGWAVTYKLADAKREPTPAAPTLTAKGNPLIDEAVLADLGLIREVFGRWKYRYAVGAPELFATTKEGAIEQGSDAYAKADPSELLTKEQRFEKSNADFYADFDARYGKMSIEQVRKIMEDAKPDQASTLAAHARESNNNGGRRTGPAVATQGAREGAELARQLERYLAERQSKETPPVTAGVPAEWTDKLLADAESGDIVRPEDVRAKLEAQEGVFESATMRGVPTEAEISEQVEALKVAQMGRDVERAAITKYEQRVQEAMDRAVKNWAIGWTLSAISTRKSRQTPDGIQPNGKHGARAQQYMTSAKADTATARSDAAFLEALKRRNPAKPVVDPAPTGRAPAGGTIGMNGEHYKGGTFLPNTTLPKQGKAAGGTGGGRGFLIEPGVYADPPGEGYKSILNSYSQFIHVNDGIATVYDRGDVAIENFVNPDVAEGRAFLRAAAEAYNNGMRWFKPDEIVVGDEHRKEPEHEIIEHVTKGGKGKTIRGIVRTDLSYAEAKAIDEYTFRKDGGYFIREKHLAGGAPAPSPTPKVNYTELEQKAHDERQAELRAQAEADRLANEQLRQQQKITQQVTKLRDVAASTLERADAEIGRDRLANTRRRASMAASGIANAEASRAIALTMNNLADAIERGQAQHLAGITSRADVQTLSDSLRNGRYAYERANNISHTESERRKHDPYTNDEAFYAQFPSAKWDTAGASRARILEMIKGKRGAPAIANEIRYANEMTREQIQALRNILGQKEVESNLGWWNVEQLARAERLRRAGITNTMQLRQALAEFIEFKAGARQEDPIAKAERAIIGQKVGIDFFPTPKGESKTMATLAGIKEGDDVLEPSAGNGNLADAAKAAGANVDVIEISSQLRDILTAKGYTVVAHDFSSYTPTKQYDAILMNPPFSNRQDADHIMRAFTMLKPGGRLVAIAGEGVFFGRDAKATAFREWLDEHGAEVEALAGGTFKDTSLLATTGANARRIVLTR